MAATIFGIANPTVLLNGEILSFVPNSLSFKRGFGDVKTRPESAGGENVDNVVTRDLTTATGHFTFKMTPTADNIALIINAQENFGNNEVQIINAINVSMNASMSGASIMNDPDFAIGADTDISIEMQGNQWVVQI